MEGEAAWGLPVFSACCLKKRYKNVAAEKKGDLAEIVIRITSTSVLKKEWKSINIFQTRNVQLQEVGKSFESFRENLGQPISRYVQQLKLIW